jgi:tetratricopeptide (TPR) repeat protein
MVDRAFADLRAASGANLAEATRPLESLQRFVIASCEALSPALDGFVAAETLARFTDQCRTLAERIRATQAKGLPAKVDTIVAKVLAGGESRPQTDVLPVPDDDRNAPATREARDPDRVATVAVRTLGPIALRWLEERLGRDAWPVAATRVAAMHVGRFDEAAAERELDRLVESGGFAEACDGMASLLGEEAESVVSLRTTLSEWLARRHLFAGRLAAATAAYREALACTEKTAGPDSEEAMKLRLQCGLTFFVANEPADAVRLIERVAEAGDAAGLDPAKVTDAHRFLVLALVAVKDFDRAITFAEAFLARVEAGQADDDCRREVPRVREIIGFCHGQAGDLEKSLAVYRTLLEEADERYGPDHPETSKLLHNTMWLLNQTGDVDEAYRLNRRPRAEIERRSIVGLEGLERPGSARGAGEMTNRTPR